ncbi:MAG: hypothetical protein AAB875_05800 [Patescibacteria group bacterium]
MRERGEREYVSARTWGGLARRLERERLHAFGTSLSATSIAAAANAYIIETSDDRPMLVRKGWRAAMIAAAQADDFTRTQARCRP